MKLQLASLVHLPGSYAKQEPVPVKITIWNFKDGWEKIGKQRTFSVPQSFLPSTRSFMLPRQCLSVPCFTWAISMSFVSGKGTKQSIQRGLNWTSNYLSWRWTWLLNLILDVASLRFPPKRCSTGRRRDWDFKGTSFLSRIVFSNQGHRIVQVYMSRI